jgi:PadR family transcriptional regulator, regulatory protein PadR
MPRKPYSRKVSRRARRVLLALLSDAGNLSGFVIGRAAQTGSGTVYPVLAKLESNGWVTGTWDTVVQSNGGRRRFYRLTDEGRAHALRLLGLEDSRA